MTVKTTSKTKNRAENKGKSNNLNQLKETLEAKENETEPEKDRLKRTKTVSYLTGTFDGQRATIGRACSRTATRRGYRGDGFASGYNPRA